MRTSSDAQLKIRVPARLKKRIEEAAQVNRRSLNGEIVARLADSFLSDEGSKAAAKKLLQINLTRHERVVDIEEVVGDLAARIAKLEAAQK